MGARALGIAGAVLVGCAGPDPRIERVEVVPSPRPGLVRVDLDVVNRGGGHGQVQIEIRLRGEHPPRMLAAERELELGGHQRIELTVDIPAPDGAYAVEATALYPH